ncbi:glycine cleavage system aminomethyltransferase GcvT [Tanticharoenia sakaeratensis]|uniref:aminomethyltransferase n=1 Tax=Tanticharoenia sakaeratensis NBRC 103193 TaxID=1231623 RepID=A0A0D6MQP9_9PROT|nr:glycine cleavage system aminomethyltransferase GcvT [Tanticharoenia sakaeratensis]GAN55730.1 glycine cleavage system T protein aminomethyltransferase [Tanticharoenia sakaeratensis NBRC 103193]GBQ18479.1 glycine cleavage system protein T [Tanticharoenia sakaeratensis NBRC 103193]
MTDPSTDAPLKQTPLHALHLALGVRMVPFAGYEMPLQYKAGLMAEHLHTRRKAGLFDVSHMGQLKITARSGSNADAATALETLIPADVLSLGAGRQRYGLLTNEDGGICDDLMFANMGDWFYVVVNAACKDADADRIEAAIGNRVTVERCFDRALLALQGPAAEAVLAPICPDAAAMRFMDVRETRIMDTPVIISRSGYTGEDGFEISVAAKDAEHVADALLANENVLPVGLGARDSLRLEAGLCLYGSDLDTTTSPVEASLMWSIQKARKPGGSRAGGYPGAGEVEAQLAQGTQRVRVGLQATGRAPVRGGAPLFADPNGATQVGVVTSGAFGPSVDHPVAMGYVAPAHAGTGMPLYAELRGRFVPVTVAALPFTPARFKR